MTRRDACMACLGAAAVAVPAVKSRVVIARDARFDAQRLPGLLDRAVQSYFGCDSAMEAWRKIVRPGEVVGLKVNCLSGKGGATTVGLVEAICERLRQAGVPAGNIVIWDRLNDDLDSAGFRIETRSGRIRCIGNDVLGYEDELSVYGSAGSLMAKTLTQVCDAVINLPVLKDHGIVGVTLAMKNLFGAIHNPNKYHLQSGNPYVPDVYMLPAIRRKMRLVICDGITAQYEGGPSYMPQWTWPFHGLLVAQDPVALDYTGWQIIERKRLEKRMKTLAAAGRAPLYIATAADSRHRLGTNDPGSIERIEV
ncbi:MAG: DUF362 domain-containing protein [Bryobacteraceae bacterium]